MRLQWDNDPSRLEDWECEWYLPDRFSNSNWNWVGEPELQIPSQFPPGSHQRWEWGTWLGFCWHCFPGVVLTFGQVPWLTLRNLTSILKCYYSSADLTLFARSWAVSIEAVATCSLSRGVGMRIVDLELVQWWGWWWGWWWWRGCGRGEWGAGLTTKRLGDDSFVWADLGTMTYIQSTLVTKFYLINTFTGEVLLCSDGFRSEPGGLCSHGWMSCEQTTFFEQSPSITVVVFAITIYHFHRMSTTRILFIPPSPPPPFLIILM